MTVTHSWGAESGPSVPEKEASVLERKQVMGTYSWPLAWRGEWKNGKERSAFSMTLSALKVINNWVVGGSAMRIIQGEVTYNGRTIPQTWPRQFIEPFPRRVVYEKDTYKAAT